MNGFFYNLVILIKSLLFSRNQVLCLEFENFDELQQLQVLMIFIRILYMFPTYQCLQKVCLGFFILLRTQVICQNQERPGFYTLTETRFITNVRSRN